MPKAGLRYRMTLVAVGEGDTLTCETRKATGEAGPIFVEKIGGKLIDGDRDDESGRRGGLR